MEKKRTECVRERKVKSGGARQGEWKQLETERKWAREIKRGWERTRYGG